MKRLLHTPTALLLRRIALLYAVLMLCRVIFYLYNARLLGPLSWGELGQLLAGSLKFDTASVVYADGVFVLLSLLPLHVRERKWSPTTATRCSWSANSWPKTGIWSSWRRP